MEFLNNTNIVVAIGFVIFIGILLYYRVPSRLAGLLDARAERIRADLDEARALREEAQSLLATYERRAREVQGQADEIVAAARAEAERAAESAKEDIRRSVDRRLRTAKEQIEAAENAAVREIKDRAVTVAVAAAAEVIRERMGAEQRDALIDSTIAQVETKLH
jgi:F-type H+-transporting ATPase subunit b